MFAIIDLCLGGVAKSAYMLQCVNLCLGDVHRWSFALVDMCLGGVADLPECYRVSTFVLAVFTVGFLLKSTGVLAVLQNPFTCYSMSIFVLAVFTTGVKHVLELRLHLFPFPSQNPRSRYM